MFEWGDVDQFSFDDSDRFDEDSVCSWISEPESVVNNWRGWRRNNATGDDANAANVGDKLFSLTELAAKTVAAKLPFEVIELQTTPVPEDLQKRIAFWSFPEEEEDVRLYSCLANGSSDEFNKGEHLYKAKAVREPLQIGFHLSANVVVSVSGGADSTMMLPILASGTSNRSV